MYNCRIKILFSRIIVKNLEIILNEGIGIDQDFEKNSIDPIDTDKSSAKTVDWGKFQVIPLVL